MLGWIRFAYRLLWFIVSAFLLLVPMLILAKFLGASMKFRHGLFKTWRAVFLAAMGIEVRVLEGSAPTEAAILMGNHRSYADILFVFSATPTIFLGKAEVKKWPIIGWAAKR